MKIVQKQDKVYRFHELGEVEQKRAIMAHAINRLTAGSVHEGITEILSFEFQKSAASFLNCDETDIKLHFLPDGTLYTYTSEESKYNEIQLS